MRSLRIRIKIVVAALMAGFLLTGCNDSLAQVEQALELMAENAEKTQQALDETEQENVQADAAKNDEAKSDAAKPDADKEEEPEKKIPASDIYILYTSDIHCGIDKGYGYVGLQQLRKTLEKNGCVTLLVDNGDAVQGESIGTVSKGEAIIPLMNALKYDIATPGNHEFDYGMDEFVKYPELADFPYISCNFTKEGKLVFKPYIIKELAGLKIAFAGVTTPETLTSVSPKTFMDENGNYIYGFMQGDGSELYKAVQDAVDAARAEGADYVYVMGHVGDLQDSAPYSCMDIIANTTGIDVFLDGHSHDTDQLVLKNKDGDDVPRSACGTKFEAVGYSHIKADDGSIDTGIWTWENDISIPAMFDLQQPVGDLIAKEESKLSLMLQKVVAKTDVDLTINDPDRKDENNLPVRRVRNNETNLGDLCADAARVRTGADIGIVNGGGVRADIKKGDITYENIIDVHPFGNITVVIEATGQQILDALEWACKDLPQENGGFLQVSGMSYEVDLKVTSGCTQDVNGVMTGVEGDRRVKNVRVGDKPIDPNATYTVAGNSFMLLNNGNGNTGFEGAKVVSENDGLDNQLLIDYIVETLGGTIGKDYDDPHGQGRIVINE